MQHRILIVGPTLVALACAPANVSGPAAEERPPAVERKDAGSEDLRPATLDLQAPSASDVAVAAPDVMMGGPIPTPADFTRTERGGFKLGPALTSESTAATPESQTNCNFLVGVARDFKGRLEPGGHPDFETFYGDAETQGLVAETLGDDRKPVYTGRCGRAGTGLGVCPYGAQTTTQANFDQWYRKADGVNQPFLLYFSFERGPGGLATFDSQSFFPLDGAGFGNSGLDERKRQRNFHFTTELHASIRYEGGEKFTFSGDDDLWVFINKKLALDLGGLHKAVTATIDLDAAAAKLGLSKGSVYPIELFHAERRTDGSHFKVETNFLFVNCGQVID